MIRDHRPDAGVTVIIGAILLTGIVLGAMVTVRLSFVPIWEQEAEAEHMDEVSRAMADLTSQINRRMDNTTRAPLSVPLPMIATGGTNPFSVSRSPGTLSFTPSGAPMTVSSPSFLVQVRNQTDLAGVNETWDSVGSDNEINNATQVLNLRMNITGPPCGSNVEACIPQGSHVTGTIYDARGKFAGSIETYMDHPKAASTSFLKVKVTVPTSPPTVVFNNTVHSFQQTDWDPPYWVNTLNADYRFDKLLDAAKSPYDVVLTENGMDGTFSATFAQSVTSGGGGGGTIIVGGGGIEDENYARTFAGGTLAFESQNNEFIDQDYIIENGALVLNQSDGAVFKVDPPIEIRKGGDAALVDLGIPVLTGDTGSTSGSRTSMVRLTTTSSQKIVGALGQLNITFHTEFPDLWQEHLDDELSDAGFTSTSCPATSASSPCQYEIKTTSKTVKLFLNGTTALESDPRDPSVRDISLTFTTGNIRTEVRQ